jgi:hypothetical protein
VPPRYRDLLRCMVGPDPVEGHPCDVDAYPAAGPWPSVVFGAVDPVGCRWVALGYWLDLNKGGGYMILLAPR